MNSNCSFNNTFFKILSCLTIIFLLFSQDLLAQQQFPFTEEENTDGSRFVWFMYKLAGFPYKHVSAKDFPACERFKQELNEAPKESDIAWWKEFMAIYIGDQPDGKDLTTAEGTVSYKELEKKYGPVKWFQYIKESPVKDSFKIFNTTLTYSNPNSTLWREKTRQYDSRRNKGIILFERETLIDSDGVEVRPVISIVYEKLPNNIVRLDEYVKQVRSRLSMHINKVEKNDNFILYHCIYTEDLKHIVLISCMVSGNIGLQIVCDSTGSVYDLVEKDFLYFINSIKLNRENVK